VTPRELRAALDEGRPLVVLDVREDFELALAALAGALHVPMRRVPERLGELDPAGEVVVLCHHGVRSAAVVRFLELQGFTRARNLDGGIDAWSVEIDPAVPRY
jgi:rhodanese-related sulfurtransferase